MTQLNSKKNQKKNQEEDIVEEMELPFGGKTTYYNYRCINCDYKQEVPDFVVDEFAAIDGLEPEDMPVLQCSSYGKELRCVD